MNKVLGTKWYNGSNGSCGIVLCENKDGEEKAYIAVVSGKDENQDVGYIMEWGSKFSVVAAKVLIGKPAVYSIVVPMTEEDCNKILFGDEFNWEFPDVNDSSVSVNVLIKPETQEDVEDLTPEELAAIERLVDIEEKSLEERYSKNPLFYFKDDVYDTDDNYIYLEINYGITGVEGHTEELKIDRKTLEWGD